MDPLVIILVAIPAMGAALFAMSFAFTSPVTQDGLWSRRLTIIGRMIITVLGFGLLGALLLSLIQPDAMGAFTDTLSAGVALCALLLIAVGGWSGRSRGVLLAILFAAMAAELFLRDISNGGSNLMATAVLGGLLVLSASKLFSAGRSRGQDRPPPGHTP